MFMDREPARAGRAGDLRFGVATDGLIAYSLFSQRGLGPADGRIAGDGGLEAGCRRDSDSRAPERSAAGLKYAASASAGMRTRCRMPPG